MTMAIIIAVLIAVAVGVFLFGKKEEKNENVSNSQSCNPYNGWKIICRPKGEMVIIEGRDVEMRKVILVSDSPITANVNYQVNFHLIYANGQSDIEQKGTAKAGSIIECEGKYLNGVLLMEAPEASVRNENVRIL